MKKIFSTLSNKTRSLSLTLLALMSLFGTTGALANNQSKLVIGIFVEGMDANDLETLDQYLSDDGIKSLMQKGATVWEVDFGSVLDPIAATSIGVTGAPPAITGIDNRYVFDRTRMRALEPLVDTTHMGNYTDVPYSPRKLPVSTVSDELKIGGSGMNRVFSIAPDAQSAVLLAGHAGNSAVWLNQETGNWASSTYYKDMPGAVVTANRLHPLSSRLDTMRWDPMDKTLQVPWLADHLRRYPFRHMFGKSVDYRYELYASTPLFVRSAFTLAKDYIASMKLGTSEGVDMLNILVSIVPPSDMKMLGGGSVEKVDAFLKFDSQVASLIKAARAADPNAMIYIMAIPTARASQRTTLLDWNIPTGQWSPIKAISLLNLYLIALHGNGNWILGYHNRNFYLNRDLIKEKDMDYLTLAENSAEFLRRMEGITNAQVVGTLFSRLDPDSPQVRNSVPSSSGDIVITVAPGWEILSDGAATRNGGEAPYRASAPTGMLIISAPSIQNPVNIDEPIDARRIAPTLSRLLHVASPNGAALPSIRF